MTMKNTGKTHKSNSFNGRTTDVRKDRKSATGMNGSPKKGGHGGKFTWSGDGYSEAEMGRREVVDVRDPNFEDPEDKVAVEEDKVIEKAN